MKVIFTIDSLAQGGTEQSIGELIPHFGKNIEVIVVYFYDAHHLKELYESLNCKLYYLDIDEKYGFYDAIRKFNTLVKNENPDVVVSSLYRSLIISRLVCFWTQTPLIGTFVNERYSAERRSRFKGFSLIKYFLTWLLDRSTAFIPKKIISNSYSISLLNGRSLGIRNNKIKVIYRGRNTQNYSANGKPTDKAGFDAAQKNTNMPKFNLDDPDGMQNHFKNFASQLMPQMAQKVQSATAGQKPQDIKMPGFNGQFNPADFGSHIGNMMKGMKFDEAQELATMLKIAGIGK
jgi:hypothetical protein